MDGQISIFGLAPVKKRKPCEYSFTRYIGQKVKCRDGVHIIKKIEPYYTFFTDGTIGTPHDMSPVDREEFIQYLEAEIEYQGTMNDSIAKKNLEILGRLLNEL